MVRLISRQRGGLAALKLTKLFGIDDFPAAKDSGKVLIIIIYCYLIIIMAISEVGHVSLSPLIIIVIFWSQYHYRIWRMNKPKYVQQSSHSFMRNGKNSFVYFWQIRRNSLADMFKKSTSDWIRRRTPARKNMYCHYCSAFLNSRLDRSFASSPNFACLFIAVFSFLVRFFRVFELVHGHFHGLGVFIPKDLHQRSCLHGGWSVE